MDVYEAITGRRSVRKFKEKPVAYAVLEKCVEAAQLAPSAMNGQVCEYVIIDDEKLLPQVLNTVSLWAGVPRPESGWSAGGRPRAYIVTLVNTGLAEKSAGKRNADYDAALAVENMVLAAQGEGLGSCVITGFSKDRLKQTFNISDR